MAKALEKKLNNWKPTTNINYLLYQNQGFLIYQNKALYNGKGIYNNQADKELFMKKEAKADTKCEPKYWPYYNPLWYIGNFYSYESFESVERHCIKMGSSLGVETISKKTGEPIGLLTLLKKKMWSKLSKKTVGQKTSHF